MPASSWVSIHQVQYRWLEHKEHGGAIMTESRFDIGMKVRKEVLGSEYVEQAQARTTEFDADFQRFITETAWGSLWARADLDRRNSSLDSEPALAPL